jgi:tRNA (guanine-N7-)-methyltransferase
MSTKVYVPPPKDLRFLPSEPPLAGHAPLVLEIGPGKGEFLLHMAAAEPKTTFVAVEIKRGRFEKIAKKAAGLKLENLYMVLGDARECLTRLFKPELFDRIYVLFPDPWPKRRHSKHRLLKPELLANLRDFLKPGGSIYNATDAGFYSEEIVKAFDEVGGFRREAIESLYPTYFEKKWKALGREIDYWRFVKT